jgi:polysaccharide export outer membrane protein
MNQLYTSHFFQPFRLFLCLLVTLGGLESCTSSKRLTYFQPTVGRTDTLDVPSPAPLVVRVGDVLNVQVSSLNQAASELFNPYTTAAATADRTMVQYTGTNPLPIASGYVVDAEGNIEMPLIGKVAVRGLTATDIADVVRDRLKRYLKEPTVSVRNQSYRISVLGEVNRPSLFSVPGEITLPEALGLAGDITIFGRRDNVLLIRNVNGKRIFHHIDLTRRDLFLSPYYYLQPDDVVYVEPTRSRVTSAGQWYLLVPAALSALSFIAIIIQR